MTTLDEATPFLGTKLYAPKLRRRVVARRRLRERLDRGAESKLTLISAPAGFGKTTLLADWLSAYANEEHPVAWVSLDHGDSQPTSFWSSVIAALQTVAADTGAMSLSLLQGTHPPAIETILSPLINELSAAPNDIVLVLDDYHVIDGSAVQIGMAFLIDHLPPQIHVLIASRADPPLPLGRLRARRELTEVRAVDLRFTPDEAAAYLNEVMGLNLAASDIEALDGRTEGWIAALQLAALSIQGRNDVAAFIAGFSGNDRYIVDFLLEEVLQRQPERARRFLLQTSILGRLSGPLCDAVTADPGGAEMLEALDRANLFLVPLDDRREWYRYHHLFGDMLQARLLHERASSISGLHRRASDWYEKNGLRADAIRHAFAAEDFERAAYLVELSLPSLRQARQDDVLREWLRALPDDIIRVRPVLSIGYAGALMVKGEVNGVEARLRDAERWLDTPTRAEMVVVDEKEFRGIPAAIAMYRAGQALILADLGGTISHARRALEVVGEDDHVGRGGAAALLGLAHWTSGDLDEGQRWYADAMSSLEKAGHRSDVIGCAIALADIRIVQGRLHEAMATYERGLQLVTEPSGSVLRGAADMHVGISDLLRERDDLDGARRHLDLSGSLGESIGLEQNPYRSRATAARIREAEGRIPAALALLDEADRLYVSDYFPNVRPIGAQKARVWIRQGRLGEALAWAHERDLGPDDELSYLREFEHVTLARLLLAQAKTTSGDDAVQLATRLLERLLHAAEQGGRFGSVIEILVLLALTHQARRDVRAALSSFDRALTLAEPEGYARVFLDEGPSIAALLDAASRGAAPSSYVRQLRAASDRDDRDPQIRRDLVEPLSNREREVLRLLATELSGPGIARELVVSLNTVRSHTKNIFAKLGVNSRRAAVHRADELDLLSRDRSRP